MFHWKKEESVRSHDCSFVIRNVKARKLCHFAPHKCFESFLIPVSVLTPSML